MSDLIYLDIETTGLDSKKDEIIEIGAIKVTSEKVEKFHRIIKPEKEHIPLHIYDLCEGLTENDIQKGYLFNEIEDEFYDFIEDLPIVCHNAKFEKSFLEEALNFPIYNKFLDSLELFCIFKPHFSHHNIDYLIKNYLQETRDEKHRALEDAYDTRILVEKLLDDLISTDIDLLEDSLDYMDFSDWPWLPYLDDILYDYKNNKVDIDNIFEESEDISEDLFIGNDIFYSLDDLEEIMRDEELWEKEFPNYEFRNEQYEIARTMTEAFENEQVFFVEAPTGIGKTLSYLLVATIWAYDKDEKVFISTNTKNLQQQVHEEIPKIARLLGFDNLKITDLKGIENYACKEKINKEIQKTSKNLSERLTKLYLRNWSKRAASGDLDGETSYWFAKNNEYFKEHKEELFNAIRCKSEDCYKSNCNYNQECFHKRKLNDLEESHLCTINHSLLLNWPGYTNIDKVIIDEAHNLEEQSLNSFTERVSSSDLKFLKNRLTQGNKALLILLQYYISNNNLEGIEIDSCYNIIYGIDDELDEIRKKGNELAKKGNKSDYDDKYTFRDKILDDEFIKLINSCRQTLLRIADEIENVSNQILKIKSEFETQDLYVMTLEYIKKCRKWAGILNKSTNPSSGFCSYFEMHPNKKDEKQKVNNKEKQYYKWQICHAPLNIDDNFYENVIKNTSGSMVTSATLVRNGSYEEIIKALGFDNLGEEKIKTLPPIDPVFDYHNNSVLAIPTNVPTLDYNSEEFLDFMANTIIETSEIINGRTMVLFLSLERMGIVIDKVKDTLEQKGIRVYDARTSREKKVKEFKKQRGGVLFGSRSLFAGVDIKGYALSCLIIEKLDFPYPYSPYYKDKAEQLECKGQDAFRELSLRKAIFTLRQQFGRLIRTREDKGFVLLVGVNRNKSYYNELIGELPDPYKFEGDLESIKNLMVEKFEEWYNGIDF
ncbi:putative ATP-dependent helicase DinG [Natranaerofaba carboxydovora]|nr:putative ATP-dependent helicase DinG [Natranaerofaba carboxydovora]